MIVEMTIKNLEYDTYLVDMQWQGLRGLTSVLKDFCCRSNAIRQHATENQFSKGKVHQ